jgi:hypothetical protein
MAHIPYRCEHESVTTALDLDGFDRTAVPSHLLQAARETWRDRVRTEYQSVQIATRFLGEALAAGEPLELHQLLVDVVQDELRHVEVCIALCRALGTEPPEPKVVAAPLAPLEQVPIEERVLASAISMFCVSETFSVGYLRDLEERCGHPTIRTVLQEILGDESVHEAFAWGYVRRRVAQEPAERLAGWRTFTARLVKAHLDRADEALRSVDARQRDLSSWPEPELVDLGLMSNARLALVCRRTHEQVLAPRLRDAGLA